MEDMRIHGMGDKAQKAHIRAVKHFAGFPEALARYRDAGRSSRLSAAHDRYRVTPPTFNARIMALRFLFGTTCDREDMKRYMQFRTQPRRLAECLEYRGGLGAACSGTRAGS